MVAESSAHCISIFSPIGEKLQLFGSKGCQSGQFNEPCGVTVDDDGNILVADAGNNRIQKLELSRAHTPRAACINLSLHLASCAYEQKAHGQH